jgi:hypothetical protein
MNRLAGTSQSERASLVVAAIRAHRERESSFLTVEADPASTGASESESEGPAPWIQYRDPDAICNLDCTDAELESIRATVDTIGGVTIVEQQSVEDAGTNLRLSVPGDEERVAQVIETLFVEGFGVPESFRLWAVSV